VEVYIEYILQRHSNFVATYGILKIFTMLLLLLYARFQEAAARLIITMHSGAPLLTPRLCVSRTPLSSFIGRHLTGLGRP